MISNRAGVMDNKTNGHNRQANRVARGEAPPSPPAAGGPVALEATP